MSDRERERKKDVRKKEKSWTARVMGGNGSEGT